MRIEAPWELTIRKIEGGFLLTWHEELDDTPGLYREHQEFYSFTSMNDLVRAIKEHFAITTADSGMLN